MARLDGDLKKAIAALAKDAAMNADLPHGTPARARAALQEGMRSFLTDQAKADPAAFAQVFAKNGEAVVANPDVVNGMRDMAQNALNTMGTASKPNANMAREALETVVRDGSGVEGFKATAEHLAAKVPLNALADPKTGETISHTGNMQRALHAAQDALKTTWRGEQHGLVNAGLTAGGAYVALSAGSDIKENGLNAGNAAALAAGIGTGVLGVAGLVNKARGGRGF